MRKNNHTPPSNLQQPHCERHIYLHPQRWNQASSSNFDLMLFKLLGKNHNVKFFINCALFFFTLWAWSFTLAEMGMSLCFFKVEWQPLVVWHVFIASSFSPRSVRLGNECNESFWYQWCVGPCVACGKGFSEISAPSLPVETRQTLEMGSVRNYQPLLGQMEMRQVKAKLQELHIECEMERVLTDWWLWLL